MSGVLLICAATDRELAAADVHGVPAVSATGAGDRILSVTGAGIPLTLAHLIPLLASARPALVVDIGIAGAYPGSGLSVGDIVVGESEVFGDLGLEIPGEEGFRPVGAMPWSDQAYRTPLPLDSSPFLEVALKLPRFAVGKGCTVNACAGTRATGERRRRLFGADFESMEGAAAALACGRAGVRVAEARAISNAAADRDMRPENVALALDRLGAFLRAWLEARA